MSLHNDKELNDLLDLNAVKHRTRLTASHDQNSTRIPSILYSTVEYHGANMHPGNTNSEVLYSTNGTEVPDFWSEALNSPYDDGIYDG
ncbi:unnamed protein product [Didymodactylos carnosus]|uniref:Uncharacterized protein n=1 Tax=Didymodactylos carnosus TaxID=1234261 RepID=A0A814DFR3_9BILA|nr:unnamed protein product [Didymodactylos carnosus]CAF3729140.1 unnamed protein product [Didymodactylos carnosus]